jgi:hypothetical protein
MSNSLVVAGISLACIFGGALLGQLLRRLLPDHHLSGKSEDALKVGAGMIATLAALVLGLLVGSAKSTLDNANSAITQSAVKIILLDRTLARYGPEAKDVREQLRLSVETFVALLWPEEGAGRANLQAIEHRNSVEAMQSALAALKPTDEQHQALRAQAEQLTNDIQQIRWQSIEQEQAPLPIPFLAVLLFWVSMLYVSYGLLAPGNLTVTVVQFLGALSVSGAIFLIMEMNRPVDGIIKISSAPMLKALQFLGQ